MEKVILDGVEYVKASVVAKQFHYTSDYVGQLCRSKKIDARLVGRTWFVNPVSITAHKKEKYTKPEVRSVKNQETKQQHVSVAPVIKSKTFKALLASSPSDLEVSERKLHVSYDLDDETLIPTLTKKVLPPPKVVRIEQAGAKRVRVGGGKTPFSFKSDTMPEIALSGKLSVTPIPEATKSTEEPKPSDDYKNKAITPKVEKGKHSGLPRPTSFSKIKKVPSTSPHLRKPQPISKLSAKTDVNIEKVPEGNSTAKLNLGKKTEIKFTPTAVEPIQTVKISTAVLVSPLIATVLALMVVTALFSASSTVIVSKSSYSSEIVLQVANLLEVMRQ